MPENRPAEPRLAVRHLQLLRALFAALAAGMITFSSDHSAAVGLAVFSGFAIATGLIFAIAAWLTYPTGRRAPVVALALVTLVAGMVTGVAGWRTTAMFFVGVIAWATLTGIIELVAGWRTLRRARREADAAGEPADAETPVVSDEGAARRRSALPAPWIPANAPVILPVSAQERSEARDGVVVGILSLVLAVALLLIPAGYRLDYVIDGAGEFSLTGVTIAVGVFGGYAAIVAVYLAIAGFSPRRTEPAADSTEPAAASPHPVRAPHEPSPEQSPGGTA